MKTVQATVTRNIKEDPSIPEWDIWNIESVLLERVPDQARLAADPKEIHVEQISEARIDRTRTSHDDCYGSRRPRPVFHTALSTIQAPLFARLLAELIASKGRPHLSQMTNLLPRNRICSKFISTPVNVRLALSPPRSPPFLSNKFLLNADRRLCSPKRQSPGLSSRRPISRSGARHAKNSSYRANSFRQVPPISIPPKE
jgi:hypothetical protein